MVSNAIVFNSADVFQWFSYHLLRPHYSTVKITTSIFYDQNFKIRTTLLVKRRYAALELLKRAAAWLFNDSFSLQEFYGLIPGKRYRLQGLAGRTE